MKEQSFVDEVNKSLPTNSENLSTPKQFEKVTLLKPEEILQASYGILPESRKWRNSKLMAFKNTVKLFSTKVEVGESVKGCGRWLEDGWEGFLEGEEKGEISKR